MPKSKHMNPGMMGRRRQVPNSPRMPFLLDADPLSLWFICGSGLMGTCLCFTCGSGPLLCMACPSSCTFPRQVFEKFQNWGHTTQKRGISHASRPRRKIARPARSGLEIAATKTRNIHTTPSPALPRQPPTLKTGPPGPSKGTQGRK